jgi:hypothetical protein
LLGLDRIGRNVEDFVAMNELRTARDRSNRISGRDETSYTCVLTDKFVFGQFASSLGHPVPRTRAILDSECVEWLPERRSESLDCLWSNAIDLDVFCKPVSGGKGAGVFSLRASEGRVMIGGTAGTLPMLKDRLATTFIMQDRIVQHPVLAMFNAESLNTIRLVTLMTSDGPVPCVAAGVRMGRKGMSVDNWDAGGLIIGVDFTTGKLIPPAYSKAGSDPILGDPDSPIDIREVKIPHFDEAVAAAILLHRDVSHLHSVGWDIAITDDGPVIVEGNPRWDPTLLVLFDPSAILTYVHSARAYKSPTRFYRSKTDT